MPISHNGIAHDWNSWPFEASKFDSWCGRLENMGVPRRINHYIIVTSKKDLKGLRQVYFYAK
jgi:hypothetical protein